MKDVFITPQILNLIREFAVKQTHQKFITDGKVNSSKVVKNCQNSPKLVKTIQKKWKSNLRAGNFVRSFLKTVIWLFEL